MSQNPTRKAGQQRPGRLRVLCRPRPPLRSITKEMELRRVGIFSANARKPSGHCWAGGLLSRFLRSQLRRIGLGHPLQARPRSGQSVSMAMPCPIRNCSRGPRSGRGGPGLHKPANEEPPQGGSWYPSAACRSPLRGQPRSGDPGCPRLGRDPSQIGFRLRQTGKPLRSRSLPYVTQRSPFRLPSYMT